MSARQIGKIGTNVANADQAVKAFEVLASAAVYSFDADVPKDAAAEWFIDIGRGEFQESLSWMSSRGFGFYTGDMGYGDKPNELYLDATQAFERLEQLHQSRNLFGN